MTLSGSKLGLHLLATLVIVVVILLTPNQGRLS